jgi:L-alanine-DL-glutamate epimerase-like enolase superfamily enzyme
VLTIEAIETIPLRIPLPFTYKGSYYRMRNRCTIVTRIRTSEGIIGEAYNADEDEPLQSEIRSILHDELAPQVIGLDAFAT